MRRRLTLLGFWLVGTAFAMLLAGLAVQMAGAKVTDARGATISKPQVESELARIDASAAEATISPDLPATGDPSGTTAPSGGSSKDPGSDASPSGPAAQSGQAPVLAPSGAPAVTAAPTTTIDDHGGKGGGEPTTTRPPGNGSPGGPPSTPPADSDSSELSYNLTGGTVRVHCDGTTIRVVSASPSQDFQMEMKAPGPGSNVDVRFTSTTHESEFKAACSAGVINPELLETSRRD